MLKSLLERLLLRGGPAALARANRRGDVIVLAYHNVVPDASPQAGDRSLHLSRNLFARHLDLLRRWAEVVPLEEILRRESAANRPQVAITIDDAYRGAVTVGLTELRDRELPATLFVAPGRLGGETFWWDALAVGAGLPAGVRHHALGELRGEEARIRAWARQTGLDVHDLPDLWRSATAPEISAAMYPGLALGSHSWSHPNLAGLTAVEIEQELAASRDWLLAHFRSCYTPWIAYPYGQYSASVCTTARELGFAGAFRIDGGWIRRPFPDPFAAPRLNIPAGLSADGFALRLAGLMSR
jgi:peptidoglycan/xylan/chitin deacetylase (PgdA/CDA1 family)